MNAQVPLKTLLAQNPLYVFAMQEEAGALFEGLPLLITGIGKANAAYALGKAVAREKPGIIVNLGSAGSPVFARNAVICCGRFIQRDMDATALGFDRYQTPFSSLPRMLEYGYEPPQLTHGICGTGGGHRDWGE